MGTGPGVEGGGTLLLSAELRRRIEAFAGGRRFRPAAVERWRRLPAADAAALLAVAERLRLGENQWRDVFELAEETALRQGKGIAVVLAAQPVQAALAGARGRNDALRALRAALRRLRYPQLAAAEEELAARIRALGLPRHVRIRLPPYLQGDEISIEVRARDTAAVRAAVERLRALLDAGELERVFALLREAQ